MANDTGVTAEGAKLIKAWLDTKQRVERARSQLNSAECDARNAELALGKWLVPDITKAAEGEKLAVWFGDSLIQAEVTDHDPIISFRHRGPKLHEYIR